MIVSSPSTDACVDPRLARTLWQVLALAVLGLALVPVLGGPGAMPGRGALWLVAFPAIALAVAYRGTWRRAPDAPIVASAATAHRRRPRPFRGQAQRAAAPRRERRLRVA
jgi:hypothetical protein